MYLEYQRFSYEEDMKSSVERESEPPKLASSTDYKKQNTTQHYKVSSKCKRSLAKS